MCISGVSRVVQWERVTYVFAIWVVMSGCSNIVEGGWCMWRHVPVFVVGKVCKVGMRSW